MRGVEQSYAMQAVSEGEMRLPASYRAPQSVDAWRHSRMLALVEPLCEAIPGSSWMTVGDGRYGCDAAYLRRRGMAVTATSLTDEKLRLAHEMGHIGEFAAENAERISRADGSFDFVLCKEAYHHFPRPPVALYEMLRVSRVGVVMIEPIDNPRLLDGFKSLVKRVLRGNVSQQFEPSGNYIYRPSVRELRKLMLAMGGEVMAWRGINDFYHARLIEHPFSPTGAAALATRTGIAVQDALCSARLMGYGLACIVIFKAAADPGVLQRLSAHGFRVERLPRNPYTEPSQP